MVPWPNSEPKYGRRTAVAVSLMHVLPKIVAEHLRQGLLRKTTTIALTSLLECYVLLHHPVTNPTGAAPRFLHVSQEWQKVKTT